MPIDSSLLRRLAGVVDEATAAFEGYDYARALERTESFFWDFCNDYLELVKNRAYGGGPDGASALDSLHRSLSVLLKLFAPFLPFVTEEVWSWWQEGSVHRAAWPTSGEVDSGADPLVLEMAAGVLGHVRRAKSEAKVSQRAAVERVVVRDTSERLAALRLAEADFVAAGSVAELVLEELAPDGQSGVEVTLASL